ACVDAPRPGRGSVSAAATDYGRRNGITGIDGVVGWPPGGVGLGNNPRTPPDERSVTVTNVARTDIADLVACIAEQARRADAATPRVSQGCPPAGSGASRAGPVR